MNSPVRLGVSPTTTTPTGFYSQRFWGFLFPCWNPGLLVLLPTCFSQFIHMQTWDCLVHQQLPCHVSFPPQLPLSTPPTSLNECLFFNSFVVRVPYNSIFWQFWLSFAFKFVVLLFVVWGGKVYLPMPLSWTKALRLFWTMKSPKMFHWHLGCGVGCLLKLYILNI